MSLKTKKLDISAILSAKMVKEKVNILKFSVESINHDQGYDFFHDHDHDHDHVTNLTIGAKMVGKKVNILKFSVESIDNDKMRLVTVIYCNILYYNIL